jgi:hypothetical protein
MQLLKASGAKQTGPFNPLSEREQEFFRNIGAILQECEGNFHPGRASLERKKGFSKR